MKLIVRDFYHKVYVISEGGKSAMYLHEIAGKLLPSGDTLSNSWIESVSAGLTPLSATHKLSQDANKEGLATWVDYVRRWKESPTKARSFIYRGKAFTWK